MKEILIEELIINDNAYLRNKNKKKKQKDLNQPEQKLQVLAIEK